MALRAYSCISHLLLRSSLWWDWIDVIRGGRISPFWRRLRRDRTLAFGQKALRETSRALTRCNPLPLHRASPEPSLEGSDLG